MRSLPVRRGVLALALLALVFSPGLLARARHDGEVRPSRGELAIALMAPTLDQDELETAKRPAWMDATVVIGTVVVAGLVVLVAGGQSLVVATTGVTRRRDVDSVSSPHTRAPPQGLFS